MNATSRTLLHGLGAGLVLTSAVSLATETAVVQLIGPPEIVISADDARCSVVDETGQSLDVPDAALKAVKLPDGGILGFAPSDANLVYTGQSIDRLRHRGCNPVFLEGHESDPAKFSDRQWLVSPLFLGGGTIYALVHNEYQGARYNEACRKRLPPGSPPWGSVCIYASLTGALSTDSGHLFGPVAGELAVVAAPPNKFRSDSQWYGVHDPSNIVMNPRDGYYYFVAHTNRFAELEDGACLFRTRDPLRDPWLAWDGSLFSIRMGNPYSPREPSGKGCKTVSSNSILGLSYNTLLKSFIGVGSGRGKGIYYMTSSDLVNWSSLNTLVDADPMYAWHPGRPAPAYYCSLIDPRSPSANFDTSGEFPYLYFVRWRISSGRLLSRSRDVLRIPLRIGSPPNPGTRVR